ncbi:hypothetical protein Tco_0407061 [Tanacetum coccineum]
MANLKFVDTHNLVAFLSKPTKSEGFKQIVDFLNENPIRYALTINPTIYISCIEQFWSTVKAKTVNGEVQLQALVDGKKIIITESTVRRYLQLEDAEGVDFLPNSTIFEQLTLMGSKTTAWNEFSSTMASAIIYEAIYKELDDSLVRDATTASSLEAEHDNGNIAKTQSKATPNESSSLGTTSGGGPRRQERIGDTIAQTRFENVSKHSNDLLLVRGNILRSGEDSLKLNKLMELCTNLQTRVLDLEKTKTTQAEEIVTRVESSGDKESLGEDASKQGGINAINADEDITLVNDQDDADMFDVNTLTGDEVLAEQEVATKNVNLTIDEVTLAQALAALKSVKPKVKANVVEVLSVPVSAASTKVSAATTTTTATILTPRKGIIITELVEEQEQFTTKQKAILFKELLEQRRKHFAAKRVEENRNKPPTKDQQKKTMITYLKNMEAEVDDDQEAAKIKELMKIILDEEEVEIDAIPLATKPPTIMYLVFRHMLKSFDRGDFKTLWKLVKAKYGLTRPVEDLDLILWGDLKTIFEPHVEDRVWRNQWDYKVLDWKLYDSCEVHSLRMQHMHIHMLVEKRYPLTPATITDMMNKKFQADHFSKMAY